MVDERLDEVGPEEFDALVLPSGVMSPDSLRIQPKAVAFVKAFFDCHSWAQVAAVCGSHTIGAVAIGAAGWQRAPPAAVVLHGDTERDDETL